MTPTPETVKQAADALRDMAERLESLHKLPGMAYEARWHADKLDPPAMTEAEALAEFRAHIEEIRNLKTRTKWEQAQEIVYDLALAAHDARQAGKPAARGFDPICIERAKGVRP
jgi:hypothetical protein